MENELYKPRICDSILLKKLRTSGAVLLTGPKWCGKTWTALNVVRSVLYMQDPDKRASYLKLAQTQPSLLLQGEKPRLLDEWQLATVLWDSVRFAVDQNPQKGQFILTGSVVVDNESLDPSSRMEHTGTGRISELRMRPMSLYESGDSNGTISLKDLFEGKTDIESTSSLGIEDLAYLICRGGWPATIGMEKDDALDIVVNYFETIIQGDDSFMDTKKRNPFRMRSIMKSLARNISTMTSDRTIMGDVRANDVSITDKTLAEYINFLRRLFVVDDIKAWQPSLRSRTSIRTSNKRQFVDPSIAVAALESDPKAIIEDFCFFGFLFESLCARDLRVYVEPLRGRIKHYRDNSGLEVDLIISLNNGQWAAVEVKLGSKEIEQGALHLKKFAENIDTTINPAPSFLMILTGGEYAYRRSDGVFVIPLGCLKD